jgi:hypothetical protein
MKWIPPAKNSDSWLVPANTVINFGLVCTVHLTMIRLCFTNKCTLI